MGSTVIIAAIDKELARLHQVRKKLVKQVKKATKKSSAVARTGKKITRKPSPAGSSRIAEAPRTRLAAARKEPKG